MLGLILSKLWRSVEFVFTSQKSAFFTRKLINAVEKRTWQTRAAVRFDYDQDNQVFLMLSKLLATGAAGGCPTSFRGRMGQDIRRAL